MNQVSTTQIPNINTVLDIVNNSFISLEKSKLGGDKGYISKNLKEVLKKDYKISLITCNKKIKYDKINNITNKQVPNNKNETKFLKKQNYC